MRELKGNYKSSDGKDYFTVALNTRTGEKILIKNAGCSAAALTIAMDYWFINYELYYKSGIKLFFLNTSKEIDLNKIPKKYHKYFK